MVFLSLLVFGFGSKLGAQVGFLVFFALFLRGLSFVWALLLLVLFDCVTWY